MSIINTIVNKFHSFLVGNNYIHFRQHSINTPSDFIDLVDRFIDGNLRYELEWDDFISWENENAAIEKVRREIGQHETLLFSKNQTNRLKYCNNLIEKRNTIATIVGETPRKPISNL